MTSAPSTRRRTVLTTAVLLAVPLSIAFVLNTYIGPQTHEEQGRGLLGLARASLAEGRNLEAEERIKLAMKLSPMDLEVHLFHRDLLLSQNRRSELIAEYGERADNACRRHIAATLREADSEQAWEELTRDFPEWADGWLSRADYYVALNGQDEADRVIKEGLKHCPHDARLFARRTAP